MKTLLGIAAIIIALYFGYQAYDQHQQADLAAPTITDDINALQNQVLGNVVFEIKQEREDLHDGIAGTSLAAGAGFLLLGLALLLQGSRAVVTASRPDAKVTAPVFTVGTKTCPDCAEKISADAAQCPFCNYVFMNTPAQ
jgi:hypothetical protein